MRRWVLLISSKEVVLLTDCLLEPSGHPPTMAWRISRDKTFRNVAIRYFEKTGFLCHAWLTSSELRTQARSSHRFEGSNEPPFVRQVSFFFLFALRARLVLSSHDVSAAQTRLSKKFGRTGLSTCLVHESRAVGVATTSTEVGVLKKVRSRWYQHFSSSSIAQRAVCHSCKVLQSTMKRTKESDMDGQAKLFSFGFSRGRSVEPEPNGLTPLLLVHLSRFESLRPRKSRQAVRSKKNNALEVNM